MDEPKSIVITFSPEESRFFEMVEQRCKKSGTDESDYIKDLLKRDLGWGQFMKRKKPGGEKRD